jgi:4-amino-4-deoxy-L-arabinose transferase-like glycosyltransferase
LALALAVRVAYVLFYPEFPLGENDAFSYDRLGWNLASGKGFVGRPPGAPPESADVPEGGVGPIYPVFLAAIYLIFGHQLLAVRIIQAFVSAAVILVLYERIAKTFGAETGKAWGLLMAVYPPSIIHAGVLLTETLTSILLAVVICMLLFAVDGRSGWRWMLAGAVMAMTILQRPEAVVMAVAFAAWVLWRPWPGGVVKSIGPFLLAIALVVGIWTARNYVVFHKLIIVTYRTGETVWFTTKGWAEWHYDDSELQALVRGLKYYERDTAFLRAGIRNLLSDPMGYGVLCVKRLYRLWIGSHTESLAGLSRSFAEYYANGDVTRFVLKSGLLLLNTSMIALGAVGCFIVVWAHGDGRWQKALFLIPVVVVGVIHFFLFATPRYVVPIMPSVLVFAAVALEWWVLPTIAPHIGLARARTGG